MVISVLFIVSGRFVVMFDNTHEIDTEANNVIVKLVAPRLSRSSVVLSNVVKTKGQLLISQSHHGVLSLNSGCYRSLCQIAFDVDFGCFGGLLD